MYTVYILHASVVQILNIFQDLNVVHRPSGAQLAAHLHLGKHREAKG